MIFYSLNGLIFFEFILMMRYSDCLENLMILNCLLFYFLFKTNIEFVNIYILEYLIVFRKIWKIVFWREKIAIIY